MITIIYSTHKDEDYNKKFVFDYTNNLKPFYIKNKEKLDNYIKPINV